MWKKARDLVFPNQRGSYTNHDNTVKRKFLPLFDLVAKKYEEERLNLLPPERFNWHTLRHFAVSCWIEADLKPKTVQALA